MNRNAISPIYVRALVSLVTALENQGIDYSVEMNIYGNGFVVRFSNGTDVALNDLTYGHDMGLWEPYGFAEDNGRDDVCLSVNEVLRRFSVGFDDPIWNS